MATNNVDLFSYLPGLELTQSELLEAELLSQQILSAKFPTMDLREGTAIRDLVIRPSATLLALINKALVFYFSQNTLDGVTDATPQAFVDKMMTNWFLNRKLGRTSIINARLYFSKSKNITIYSDVFFSTDGTLRFSPLSNTSFTSAQLTFDANANQYYIDMDLKAAEAGTDYNITSGSLLYFTNFDPYFLHAEINYLKESAENIETNSEFITRAKTAISTRNLINVPSIQSNLLENFSTIDGVFPVGFGDPEMTRDQIQVIPPALGTPVWIHNGGCVDVYSRVALTSSTLQLPTDSNGTVLVTGAIYKIERSQFSGGEDDDTLPLLTNRSVTSVTWVDGISTALVTITVSNHGYTTGDLVTISGAIPVDLNGEKTITKVDDDTFTFTMPKDNVLPASGTILAGVPVLFSVNNSYWITGSVPTITRVGSVATATLLNNGLMPYDRVQISGSNEAEYNGTFIVTEATKDTFSFQVAGTPSTGNALTQVCKYVDRAYDLGFSDRQSLEVDFGSTHSNKTVSLTLYMFQNMDGIQSYLSDSSNRIMCADLLARGFNITLLDMVITGYENVTPNVTIANTVVTDYLALLLPGQPFVMSDLLSNLFIAGIQTIKTPIEVTYTKYWNDLLPNTTGIITDVLNPDDTTNIFLLNTLITTSTNI